MTYEESVRYLVTLGRELASPQQASVAKFDLENITTLCKRLGQPQHPEITDVHLVACDTEIAARDDAAGANVFAGIDDDVDAAAILRREFGHRFRVGDVERHDLDAFDLRQLRHARKRLPGIGDADKDDARAGLGEGFCHRLADRVAPVADQHAAILRVTGHLAQMWIGLHMRRLLGGQREHHG